MRSAPVHGRAGALAADTLLLLGFVAALPFVIIAVGLPVVLIVQLLLWVGRLLT
jgi:hypothetical protein